MNFRQALKAAEKNIYIQAFRHCNYNQSKAAKELGVSRGTFRTKMKEWGILQ